MKTPSDELKPCPLCGDADEFNPSVSPTFKYAEPGTANADLEHDGHYVECDKCACCGPPKPTREGAIAAWNARPEAAQARPSDELVTRLRAPDAWSAHFHGGGSYSESQEAAPFEAAQEIERLKAILGEIADDATVPHRVRRKAIAALTPSIKRPE